MEKNVHKTEKKISKKNLNDYEKQKKNCRNIY